MKADKLPRNNGKYMEYPRVYGRNQNAIAPYMQHIVQRKDTLLDTTPPRAFARMYQIPGRHTSGDSRSKLHAHVKQHVIIMSAEHSRARAGGGTPDACGARGEDGSERAAPPLAQQVFAGGCSAEPRRFQ
eukprot:5725016-Pleurochrysis_carterae.AAC.1